MKFYFLRIKSDEVGTTLKHPETINGNVKNISKRIERKDKGNVNFYFKNLTLPLITTLEASSRKPKPLIYTIVTIKVSFSFTFIFYPFT